VSETTLLRRLLTVSRETALLPVHAWRLVSRFLPARCKYYPSCSSYALTAVRHHGVLRGVPMAAWRVLRCNPWSLGGVDYVKGCECDAHTWNTSDSGTVAAPRT